MRRATLRGLENLNKRHQIAAACYNLSQLLRRLYGIGTPKQWRALLRQLLASALALAPHSWGLLLTCLKSFPATARALPIHQPPHRKSEFFNSLLGHFTRLP